MKSALYSLTPSHSRPSNLLREASSITISSVSLHFRRLQPINLASNRFIQAAVHFGEHLSRLEVLLHFLHIYPGLQKKK
jgi:hypothetical protein